MTSTTPLRWRVPVAIAGKGRAAHGRLIETNLIAKPLEIQGFLHFS
jgi:hypothetical protein